MLLPRDYRNDGGYYVYDRYDSPWYNWGRWVLSAAIIIFFIFFIFLLSCISARRRRRAGMSPFYGTGWMSAKPPPGHGPAMYTGPQPMYAQAQHGPPAPGVPYQPGAVPAPPYSAQPYQGSNAGYYAPQTGIELQQPHNTYQAPRGGEQVYAPPPGPPPPHMKP